MTNEIRHFTDLRVWRKGHGLFVNLLADVKTFPPGRPGDVVAEQLIRAVGSVCANIAEGFNRSKKRFVNCLDIALGEANEAENWLYKVRDGELIERETAVCRLRTIVEVEKMLGSLKRRIAASDDRIAEEGADYVLWGGEADAAD